MLYFLSDSLIVKKEDKCYFHIRKVLRNLLTGYLESKLLLQAEYDVIEWIIQIFKEDADLQAAAKSLENSYYTFSIPEEILCYVEVVVGVGVQEKHVNNKCVFQVPYNFLEDSSCVQSCVLIGEDENDCEFYNFVLSWYLNFLDTNISTNFRTVHGGGVRMATNIKKYAFCYVPTLAIADTDDKYEGQKHEKKTTCMLCEDASYGHKCMFRLKKLEVHEVENLLPLNYVDMLKWDGESLDNKRAFDFLRNNAYSDSIFRYFDFKDGIHLQEVINDNNMRTFAEKCFWRNTDLIEQFGSFEKYLDELKKNENEDSVVYLHIRKGALGQVLRLIKDKTKILQVNGPELLDFQNDEWNEIGQLMLSWGCARNDEALNF